MPHASDDAASVCDAIVHGTFPQSEDLLTADLSSDTIPTLLQQISQTRQELSDEIKANSQDESGVVDRWITQAKKVQEDIARCKIESKRIVEEHQEIQALRDEATDYRRKVKLLEKEIEFTETLSQELQRVILATESLKGVEQLLSEGDPCAAAAVLRELDRDTSVRSKSRTSLLIRNLADELRLKARVQLEAKLSSQISVRRDPSRGSIEVCPNELDNNAVNSEAILGALQQIDNSSESIEPVTDKLRTLIIHPLRQSARWKLAAYHVQDFTLSIELDKNGPSLDTVIDFVRDLTKFFHSSLSTTMQNAVVQAVVPDLMALLVTDWLDPALPLDLATLDRLDEMRRRVSGVQETLHSWDWPGQTQLQDWGSDIHRTWLSKRKSATLDAVRKAFASSKGVLRQVERVERQVISDASEKQQNTQQDWDASWDNDATPNPTTQQMESSDDAEEEATGWGFDDDEDEPAPEDRDNQHLDSHDLEEGDAGDAGDAWGWDDESPVAAMADPVSKDPAMPSNGSGSRNVDQEVTLTELYSISEIPDHLIEIIGRDIADAQLVQETSHKSLDTSSASRGLLSLPTLALAMFRATAPSYYGASPSLTDIHRYNDSLYIAERLRDMSNVGGGMPRLEADVKAMEKFAKLAYSKEMETQRIIVWDLLEGAQGFTSCTQFPYSQEIENAVASVVDRIRALASDWKPVLSTSALMQSVGSLVAMVVGKIISSVEEMDDISEPESRRLTAFCQQIAALEDLFVPTVPAGTEAPQESVSMAAVYVSNWLRFQYLINLLESSLVDIKYLWTEGELSLEFTADEVVDLIKALFAESSHRRSAIAAIKGNRGSR